MGGDMISMTLIFDRFPVTFLPKPDVDQPAEAQQDPSFPRSLATKLRRLRVPVPPAVVFPGGDLSLVTNPNTASPSPDQWCSLRFWIPNRVPSFASRSCASLRSS